MSPIDVLSGQLFSMHMTQHLLLTMVAVPLLLIGNPFPVLVWGLPWWARRPVSAVLSEGSPWRSVLAKATGPGIVWLLYVITLIGWHDPLLYGLALRNQFVHDLQHLSFFITTALLWWHILGVAPRLHRSLSTGQRIIYTISVVPVNVIIGVVIAFAPSPIYEHYVNMPRLLGLSVIADQMIAGILMWIPGSEMFFWAALIVLTQIINAEAKKPVQPDVPWLVEEHALRRAHADELGIDQEVGLFPKSPTSHSLRRASSGCSDWSSASPGPRRRHAAVGAGALRSIRDLIHGPTRSRRVVAWSM